MFDTKLVFWAAVVGPRSPFLIRSKYVQQFFSLEAREMLGITRPVCP